MTNASHYTYRVEWSEEDTVFVARVLEFPSLAAHGKTQEKALLEIGNVVRETLKDLKENRETIPEPFSNRKFSGVFNVRLPESVHRELSIEAEESGVSLNTVVLTRLLKAGRRAK